MRLQTAPTQPVPATGEAPAPLPSRRDRAALRRPTALDEPAVAAGDTALWRSLAAADDPGASAALQTHAPLTRALARSIAGHLTAPAPSLDASPSASEPPVSTGRAASRRDRPADWDAPAAPLVPAFVPRRRSAPLESGPLAQVPPTGLGELPPPPSAAEVEAVLRARTAAQPPARPSTPASAPVSTPLSTPVSTPVGRAGAAAGSDLSLTSADLEALRVAAAVAAEGLPATPPAGATAGATAVVTPVTTGRATTPAAARPTSRAARPTARDARPTGRATRSAGRSGATAARPAQPPASRHTRPGASAASRRWYQRRALGLPVGVLTAAAALVVAVSLGLFTEGGRQLTPALLSAVTGSGSAPSTTPGAATPPASTPGTTAEAAAQDDAAAQGAAGAPAASDEAAATGDAPAAAPADPAASQAAAAPAASAAATASIPTGDVTYEGFGTAKNTYVELGTADAFEARTDLGATFDQPMTGSAAWPGWYVGVRSQDGQGTVGCRIKDASGKVLVEEQSAAGDLVLCDLGSPAEFS